MFHGSLYPSCKVQYTLARVYTQFNPRKKPSTLHIVSFLPDFQAFRCEGLDFQVFTLAVNQDARLFKPESSPTGKGTHVP